MDIVHCLDNNYVPFCGTAMVSCCENNSKPIHFHIISSSLSDDNKSALKAIANKYGKQISFYDVDENILKDCIIREGDHVSVAAYLRILIPNILSVEITKVLYLDCDLIVCGDLSELFNTDLTSYACGGVYDGSTDNITTYNRLKYPIMSGYFNTGVLLMNIDYWRKNDITAEIFKFIKNFPERLLWWDQDAINGVLLGKIKFLPFKYNMTDPFYMVNLPLRQVYIDEIELSLFNPVILHFATSNKPWYPENQHPLKYKFYHYLSLTQWEKRYPIRRKVSLKRQCLNLLERYLNICVTKLSVKSPYRNLKQKNI